MISKIVRILILLLILCVCGCVEENTYTTIIRMKPDGTSERWKVCSGVVWNNDGSVSFTPLKLSHKIRITGCLTVYDTKVVVVKKEKETEEKQ